ncbi:MAG: hypothetical protein WAK48_24150 [Candidatus Acidiferrum sp.]|jgi:hypothetical protein
MRRTRKHNCNEIRKLFLIPEHEIDLNNGTVGSSPTSVLKAVFEGYRDSERLAQADAEDYIQSGATPRGTNFAILCGIYWAVPRDL